LHPYNYAESTPLLEYHSKHGIVTEAYGSLAFVFYLFNDVELNKDFFRSITTFPGGPVDAAVEKAAKRLGITFTQVIFLWVKAKGAVIVTSVEFYFILSIPDMN
jgi:diketogulonate reductase-like aldo/keto reductase